MTDPKPWYVRVRVMAGMAAAVLALSGTVVGMVSKGVAYFATRDAIDAALTRDIAAVSRSVGDLHDEVRANHDETKQHINALEQSWHEARAHRDDELAHVGDKIERVEQDVSRIGGQVQFLIKNPQQ